MAVPTFLDKFTNEEITNLVATGSVVSEYDEFGVLRLDFDESELVKSTISLPLVSDVYNDDAVEEQFETAFSEFEIILPNIEEEE